MIVIKNHAQLEKMRRAGMILYEVLECLSEMLRPGVTTREIDDTGRKMILKAGGKPSFLGYRDYPASVCVSPNDVVVHGIPNEIPLGEGDILSMDCGVIWEGFHADSARTVPVGKVSGEAMRLIAETERCFWYGACQAQAGNRVSDISWAVESHARSCGYGVVKELCGHGIGEKLHEDPEIVNFGPPGKGVRLRPGMTICVEPMITGRTDAVTFDKSDGWTVRTADGALSAHYEHTLLIMPEGPPEVLTLPREKIPAWAFSPGGPS